MNIQSMLCHEIDELSEDSPASSKESLQYPSPPASTAGSFSSTASHDYKHTQTAIKKAGPKKKHPVHRTRRVVRQPDLVRIAPKLDSMNQSRYPRSHPGVLERSRSPPSDRSRHAGISYPKGMYDTYGMTEVDLLYMRTTPVERAAFRLPGPSISQSQGCKHSIRVRGICSALTWSVTLTKEVTSSDKCCSSCTTTKSPGFNNLVANNSQSQTLPPYARVLEHALRRDIR